MGDGKGSGLSQHCWGGPSRSDNNCPKGSLPGKCTMGWQKQEGTLTTTGKLCSTDLFFNAGDKDGDHHRNDYYCGRYQNEGMGPCFSGNNNNGCPLDDPGGFTCWSNPRGAGHNLLYMGPANNKGHNQGWTGNNQGFVAVFGR